MSKELIERLRTHSDDRLYFEADVLMAEAADALEAQQKRIEELEAELKTERCLSFRTQVCELEEQIRHPEMGTGERLAAAQKRIELYEQALLASWPDGAIGDAFNYWNAARKEDK